MNTPSEQGPAQGVANSSPRAGLFSRGFRWLLRSAEIEAVSARIAQQSLELTQGLAVAKALLRQARRIQDFAEPLAERSVLACSQEAARVLTWVQFRKPLALVLEQHDAELIPLCNDANLLAEVRRTLTAAESPPTDIDQQSAATAMFNFAMALLQAQSSDQREKGRLIASRIVRVFGMLVVLLVLIFGASYALANVLAPPDLASKAKWHASSNYAGCDFQAGTCDGNPTEIFFHTQEEQDPSIEYDLGAVRRIRRVDISNRADCCQERAVPLIVEVSLDRKRWQEVSRRVETFRSVKLTFAETEARYVRLRANERTWLHFEKVAIRGQ